MRSVNTNKELQDVIQEWKHGKSTVGFVPTMGALHMGHIQLVEKSCNENDFTIVSIFVNPKQFNNKEDFNHYPRTVESDSELLKKHGCDLLFLPLQSEIYPEGNQKIELDLGVLNEVFEGPNRPGHFDGVVQVVHRFFDLVKPDKAYFGLKDYQQCMVVKQLRDHYFKEIDLIFCPTSRTESGLAMSSRNARLSKKGIETAAIIYKALNAVKSLYQQVEPKDALFYGSYILKRAGMEIEYFDLANSDSLISNKKWMKKGKNVILVAVWLEGVRLIDNMVF
ncbi:MAG TPA: pantoate--beta-alanine ligase [Bacteroidia bacterium]